MAVPLVKDEVVIAMAAAALTFVQKAAVIVAAAISFKNSVAMQSVLVLVRVFIYYFVVVVDLTVFSRKLVKYVFVFQLIGFSAVAGELWRRFVQNFSGVYMFCYRVS